MLHKKEINTFLNLLSSDDYTVASGCSLMVQLAHGLSLIEMSLVISKKHNKIFDYNHLIGYCQAARVIALDYLQVDHHSLREYKKTTNKQVLLHSSQKQLELARQCVRRLAHLENEVYLPTKSDYLIGVLTCQHVFDAIKINLQM